MDKHLLSIILKLHGELLDSHIEALLMGIFRDISDLEGYCISGRLNVENFETIRLRLDEMAKPIKAMAKAMMEGLEERETRDD
jgi:hypothetical protein